MSDHRCHRCDRMLNEGQTRYVVSIHVTADVDPQLPADADPAVEIPALLAALEGRSESELRGDVHSDLAFTLCGRCRVKWVDNPLGLPGVTHQATTWLH